MAELLKDAEQLKTLCPACKKPLFSGEIKTTSGIRYIVWCPRSDCDNMSAGPNEGGYGKTPEKALKVLMAKLGLSKDYDFEPSEPTEESVEESPKSEKSVKEKKVRKGGNNGKRGRVPAIDNSDNWIVPVGQFTMKEFCEKNETYPYKALPFFKTKGIEECGKKEKPEGQRGKAATLFSVKI